MAEQRLEQKLGGHCDDSAVYLLVLSSTQTEPALSVSPGLNCNLKFYPSRKNGTSNGVEENQYDIRITDYVFHSWVLVLLQRGPHLLV